jgi:hypothetical protein
MSLATEQQLVTRVRRALQDNAGERFGETAITDALKAEARALFASPAVPSDMLLSVCSEYSPQDGAGNRASIASDGRFGMPEDCLRLCSMYCRSTRITDVEMSKGPSSPMNVMEMPTRSTPSIFIEGANTYLLPPNSFAGATYTVNYIPREFSLDKVPPAFEDTIVYGAASRMAADSMEIALSEVLEKRAATHLSRVIGGPQMPERRGKG